MMKLFMEISTNQSDKHNVVAEPHRHPIHRFCVECRDDGSAHHLSSSSVMIARPSISGPGSEGILLYFTTALRDAELDV